MLLALLLSLSLLNAQDQTRVRASLSSQFVRVGESVTLTIIVESRSQSFRRAAHEPVLRPPRLPSGLRIVAQQQSVQQSFSMPGGRTHTLRQDLALIPIRAGTFEIPPIQAEVGGTIFESSALELVVTDSPSPSIDETASGSGARLLVSLTPDTVYVGEQVTLTAELLVDSETQLRAARSPVFTTPAPSEFWVHDLPASPAGHLRILNNRQYLAYDTRRAYFPLTPGRFQFESVQASFTARQGFLMFPETRELASTPPPLVVLPLPETNRPDSFTGAVGQYTMSVDVQPREVAAGDAISLTVRLAGNGNIKTLPAPKLPAIEGMEVLSPSEVSETTFDNGVVGGEKTFSWVLIPQRPGHQRIPSIAYAAFDPDKRDYTVLESDPIEVRVTQGAIAERTAPELSPLRPQRSGAPLGWVYTRWFALAQLAPPLLVLAILAGRRQARSIATSRVRARCMRRLDALDRQIAAADLYDRVAAFLRDCISEMLGVDVRAATSANIATFLTGILTDAQIEEVTQLLRILETARYAARPGAGQERRDVLARVRRFVRSLPVRPPMTRHAIFLAGLLLLQQPAGFEQGVAAFQSGRIHDAVNSFRAWVGEHPDDPSGWYNLGNAYARAGDRALATWAWLNTVALEPRANDALHNLQLERAGRAVDRVRPFARLSDTELILLCAVAWWTAWGVLLLAPRKWRRKGVLLGLMLIVLAGGLMGARTIERRRPPVGIVYHSGIQGRAEPNRFAEATLPIQRGATVVILRRQGDWMLVQVPDGQEVWVERAAILPVAQPRL